MASRAVRLAARRFSQRKNAVNGKDDRTIAPLPGREFPKPHSPLWLALRSPVAAQPEEVVAQRAAQKAAAADAAAKAAEDARRKAERAAEKVAEKRAEKQFDDMMSGKGYANVSPSTLAGPVGSADVKTSERVDKLRNFAMTPLELKNSLDEMVIGQENAKKALSVAFCEHFHHARRCIEEPDRSSKMWHKKNILLVGPTGTGKTQLCRALARVVDAPYVKADATTFSATGFVGRDVDDVIHQLHEVDNEAAPFGVVHIDEVDKICPRGLISGTVNTRDVQTALLKLMEDAEVPLKGKKGDSRKLFSTKHVLFVFSGAFEQLSSVYASEGVRAPQPRDLINAGLLHEFVGRVPIRCALEPLSVDHLLSIMESDSEISPLTQYRDMFAAHAIDLSWDTEALRTIAERAHAQRLGARALVAELDAVFREFAFALPGSSIKELRVTPDLVMKPEEELRRLLAV